MNKNFLKGRNLIIGLLTLAIGVVVAVGVSKVWASKTETVTGNVTAFILNPEGKVDGAVLDTGDQVKFGAETGEVVTASVQIGSALTATGHAGTSSNYGREFHAQSLQIGDQAITISHHPREPKDGKPKGPKGKRPEPRGDEKPLSPPAEMRDENAPTGETANVSGTVKYVLVNKDGDARGLILANGEQLNLGKEVEEAGVSFDQNTNVSAEGEIAKSQFGTFVRAKVLTIGNQTFTFGR